MKRLSIGLRLTLWYVAIFALAQFLFGAGMWFIVRHSLNDLVDDGLESQVEDLKTFLKMQPPDASITKIQEEVHETYSLEHSGDYLQIYESSGNWIYRSDFLRANPILPNGPRRSGSSSWDNKLAGRPFRFITQKVEANGRIYLVQMGVPNDDVKETLTLFRRYLAMFAPVVLLLAAAGGYWLSHRALAPVDAIVRSARAIGGGNLSTRLSPLHTGDELQRLSDTLNEMLDRIESAFLRVTEFTADASHELRTPVSLMRTEAELALRRSRSEEEYKEALRHILLEAERTTVLIEELLSLARADSGREMLHRTPVDLSETLRGMVDGWRQVASIRNLQFTDDLGAGAFVLGDEAALRRVVNILLDNAFKYTPAPGTVHLSLESQGDRVGIVVQDSGSGIAREEHTRIFERFYRVDKARSREMGGAGLGLSIAQWIVQQHRGSISVSSDLGRGATFRVELPLAVAPVQSPLLA